MQQHSEAYIKAMNNQKRRRLKKRFLTVFISASVTVAAGFAISANQEHQEVKTEAVTTKQPIVTGGIATQFSMITELPDWYEEPDPFNDEEEYLLAKLAMAEAEGEDTIGKALVIRTVLNRVESDLRYFPDTIAEVIFQDEAFTPTMNGRYSTVEPNEDCYAALELIKEGWDDSQGALYFERNTTKETWHTRNLKKLFVHGNHTFYTEVTE